MQTGFDLVASLVSPLISPNFTGIPTAPTATVGTNTTQLATTAFVLAQSFSATGAEFLTNKDASGGYAGLTLYKVNFKNAANTFTSYLTNANTAARTYTYPDKDGTVAMTVDITGGTLAGSFTTLSATGAATMGAGLAVTGSISVTGAITGTSAGVRLPTASPIYFNAGFNTYIQEVSAGNISVVAGGTAVANFAPTGLTIVTPAGLGYGTGAGGTVTQATDKTTAVTLNKPTGVITMNAAALAANAVVTFILNNTLILSNDVVCVTSGLAGAATYQIWVAYTGNSVAYISVRNTSAGSLSEAVQVNFAVIKGATS